ncbi:hypothetical protein D3C87_1068680 [compost metagenome]
MGGLFLLATDSQSVFIESAESKNLELKSVFNEIRWIPGIKQDVWMMNQSHFGRHLQVSQWERLAIVIDKTQSPPVAKYYQLAAGPLVWEESLLQKQTPYRASCFICHNNGPRALRPVSESQEASLSFRDRAKIQFWNWRIKTYGRIHYDRGHDETDKTLEVPFSFHTPEDQDELKVKTCVICHKEQGLFARGALVRQQTGTIKSMVARGEMPPPGFDLSELEKRELQNFLKGF